MFSLVACGGYVTDSDTDSKVSSDVKSESEEENIVSDTKNSATPIMSSDRVMSKYFDISLFDEENYADIYLGEKFKIDSVYNGVVFDVPTTIDKMAEKGWTLSEGNTYDANALVFAYETIETVMKNDKGILVKAWFYNPTHSSMALKECKIVKFLITNDFYIMGENHSEFNINSITNTMAITDVINALGTPTHFYKVSDNLYYLDYFITEEDRRNGITVYINPV